MLQLSAGVVPGGFMGVVTWSGQVLQREYEFARAAGVSAVADEGGDVQAQGPGSGRVVVVGGLAGRPFPGRVTCPGRLCCGGSSASAGRGPSTAVGDRPVVGSGDGDASGGGGVAGGCSGQGPG